MTASELRQAFLDYFAGHGHAIVPSASLLIKDDPSLLFTNAGMNQFKAVFLGQEQRSYSTACSSQKCFRVSGKHNDLENVGVTPRHHTFFEMLGNFSFGDYFKKEAIAYGWEFLTQTVGLDPERLWATVYTDDDEAEALWRKTAPALKDRILRFDESENYWSMGDVGPCGPCSEIHYDLGAEYGCGKPGCTVNCDCDRYLEIWNLVFMQYNRDADGVAQPLPRPSVDTGMGLERLAVAVQGRHSNYDTDLFQPLIQALAADSGVPYDSGNDGTPHRVCADHLRGLVFTISDGGMPGNEGAGYVLRRILRRAARLGKALGYHGPFLHRFVDTVIAVMGDAYPGIRERRDHVIHVIKSEETRFAETLDAGLARFEATKAGARGGVIPGAEAFKLYDTFGFPLDLTEVLAREAGLTVDIAGFEAALAEQRKRSRAQTAFKDLTASVSGGLGLESEFVYETLASDAKLLWASDDGTAVILDRTPCYTEAGGQIDDVGRITGGDAFVFEVARMEKVDRAIVHHGRTVTGNTTEWKDQTVRVAIDAPRRRMIQRNHTATHLLHKALRTVLGDHAQQAGSLVAPDRLRFDFSHTGPMTPEQIEEVAKIVNREILANTPVQTDLTDYKTAIADGVTALFGEKYEDEVRVVKIGDYSSELCGGTHVRSTGEIGLFRITTETGVAAGVRRIEAITGEEAVAQAAADARTVQRAAGMLKTSPDKVLDRMESTIEEVRNLRSELTQMHRKLAEKDSDLAQTAMPIAQGHPLNFELVDGESEGEDVGWAKASADILRTHTDPIAGIYTSAAGAFVSSASPAAVQLGLHLGEFVKEYGESLGVRGGGRADFVQGRITKTQDHDEWDRKWREALVKFMTNRSNK